MIGAVIARLLSWILQFR